MTWSAAVAVAIGLLFGCSLQGEGERCDQQSNNEDCESGLVCTSPLNIVGDIYRCCPPEGEAVSDDRCRPSLGDEDAATGGGDGLAGQPSFSEAGQGGVAARGGAGGAPAGAAGGEGGMSIEPVRCSYPSDCDPPLVCGPAGICQPECLEDRDCVAPQVCDPATMSCVGSATAGASGS